MSMDVQQSMQWSEEPPCRDAYRNWSQGHSVYRHRLSYMVESIVEHKPIGPRRTRGGGLRKKSMYSFKVKYALLPESIEVGEENPCWQPWDNCEHLEALKQYCMKPEILRELGRDFYVSEDED